MMIITTPRRNRHLGLKPNNEQNVEQIFVTRHIANAMLYAVLHF
jgi:hypothetical protein